MRACPSTEPYGCRYRRSATKRKKLSDYEPLKVVCDDSTPQRGNRHNILQVEDRQAVINTLAAVEKSTAEARLQTCNDVGLGMVKVAAKGTKFFNRFLEVQRLQERLQVVCSPGRPNLVQRVPMGAIYAGKTFAGWNQKEMPMGLSILYKNQPSSVGDPKETSLPMCTD